MKMFNLSENQVSLVIKSLRERLADFEDEMEILEGRIKEIISKRKEITEILTGLWSGDAPAGAKKRGRKPGSGRLAQAIEAIEEVITPKKRGRKPGSKNKAKSAAASKAAPKKRGRKPKAKTAEVITATPTAEPKKRGRKPKAAGTPAVSAPAAAPKKRGRKPKTVAAAEAKPAAEVKSAPKTAKKPSAKKAKAKKATVKKTAAKKTAAKKAAPVEKPAPAENTEKKTAEKKVAAPKKATKPKVSAKKAATKKVSAKKAAPAKSKAEKESGPTLASKIHTVIESAGKPLNTNEITEGLISKFGPVDDKRKFMQAISSTLIGMAKRGKIIREDAGNKQFVNKIA